MSVKSRANQKAIVENMVKPASRIVIKFLELVSVLMGKFHEWKMKKKCSLFVDSFTARMCCVHYH